MGVMARFGVTTAAQVSTCQLPNMMACMDTCKHVAWTNDWHISSMCAHLGNHRGLSSQDRVQMSIYAYTGSYAWGTTHGWYLYTWELKGAPTFNF